MEALPRGLVGGGGAKPTLSGSATLSSFCPESRPGNPLIFPEKGCVVPVSSGLGTLEAGAVTVACP